MTRTTIAAAAPLGLGAATRSARAAPAASAAASPFRFGLNTSTIRGQKLPLADEVDLIAEVGYDGIEPWIRELEQLESEGGSLADLSKRIKDKGLEVYSAIGFFDWAVDDAERRRKGLETARRSMDLVRQIGGTRIAAPPTGATDVALNDLDALAERFARVCEVGASIGVTPQLEIWGFSKTLTRLAQAAHVVVGAGHPQATILADVYHLYKGGSPFDGLRLLSGQCMQVFHMNDYPPDHPPETITDADRVFPGHGIAPLPAILGGLLDGGFDGFLSLELFNKTYWEQDPREVARTGLASLRETAAKAIESRQQG